MVRPAMLLFLMVLTACAGGGGGGSGSSTPACASNAFKGTWRQNGGALDEYRFNADCTGTNLNCSLVIYRYVITAPGTLAIFISSTSGAGACPAIGQTDCIYNFVDASNMSMNCGGLGVVNYSKIAI